jgi:hypothetical protein
VAYRIQLPERFSAVHNVFHVTQLKKGMPAPENEIITDRAGFLAQLASIESTRPKRAKDPKADRAHVQDPMEPSHGERSNVGDEGLS